MCSKFGDQSELLVKGLKWRKHIRYYSEVYSMNTCLWCVACALVWLLTLLLFSFGAAVTEQQKRPSLAYDSKIYERHDARANKVGFCYALTA